MTLEIGTSTAASGSRCANRTAPRCRAGIGTGDVILAVNDQPADRLDLYRSALARIAPDAYFALPVMRRGRLQYCAIAP